MTSLRWNGNRLTAKLGIEYPIIQGPLGGLSSQKLTAAVSNFGGLGSFGAHSLPPEAIKGASSNIQTVFSDPIRRSGSRLAGPERPGIQLHLWDPAKRNLGGVPDETHRHDWHGNDTRGGHGTSRGRSRCHRRLRFRSRRASRLIPPVRGGFTYRHLFAHPSDCRHVSVPLIAAGGIADARGVIATLALGAEAVQMGTAFLACEESGASLLHRQALRGKKAGHTALTKGCTGRLARGIHNRLLEGLNQQGTAILPYSLQRRLVRNLAIPAEAAGRSDLLPLWAGQSANLSTCTDVLAFLTALVEEVSEIAEPIMQWSAARREKQILK